MKNLIVIFFTSMWLSACGGGSGSETGDFTDVDESGTTSVDVEQAETELTSLPVEQISADEEADLIILREEEKVARDTYLKMYEFHGKNTFKNIADAEQTHTDTVKILLDKYEIADPVLDDTVGVFTNADLQALYDALVDAGRESLEAAYYVGAEVEELDIYDIRLFRDRANNEDILNVYDVLEKGSRNHLRSYWKVIVSSGYNYTPSHLSQSEFDAIVNSDMEKGQ